MPADFDETMMRRAAYAGPLACIWEADQTLVVPRTYRRLPRFADACRRFARLGWPITVRQSGGGLVPQGPGIINLSLAYAADGPPLSRTEDVYRHLCALIAETLDDYGIASQPQAVAGSFCDGRYNLAWIAADGTARKIAGTAQLWRRIASRETSDAALVQVVLAHAVILAAVDTTAVTRVANGFERAAGGNARYEADRIVSIHAIVAKGSPIKLPESDAPANHGALTSDLIASLARRAKAAPAPSRAPPRY